MQSQLDFGYEEENKGSSNDIPAGEYLVAGKQDTFQFGFGSSKPGQNDKDSNLVVTVIDRSSIHKIGVTIHPHFSLNHQTPSLSPYPNLHLWPSDHYY